MSERGDLRAPPPVSPREIRAAGSMEEIIAKTVERAAEVALQRVLDLLDARTVERRKPTNDPRLSTREVGRLCGGMTDGTVRQWIAAGKLIAERAGNRWAVRPAELERFLSGTRPVAATPSRDEMDDQVSRALAKIHGGSKR